MRVMLRSIFLALWFGASIGWAAGALTSLSPSDVVGSPEISNRRTLDSTLLPDTACTGFGREQEAEACRSIACMANEREHALHQVAEIDLAIYLLVILGPIPLSLTIGMMLTAKWGTGKRPPRHPPTNLDTRSTSARR